MARGKVTEIIGQTGQEDDDRPGQETFDLLIDFREEDNGNSSEQKMAIPPRRGVVLLWIFRPPGASSPPNLSDSRETNGTAIVVAMRDVMRI